MAEKKKMTPEEVARQNRAERQLEELDEAREKTVVPIHFEVEPFDEKHEPTSIESLLEDFPEMFIQKFTHNGKTHSWNCVRLSHFDIFPDSDEDDEVSLRGLYTDAVLLITKVVQEPQIKAEHLAKLPVSLVNRISRGIQEEIMPRYSEDPESSTDDVPDK